MYSIGSMCISNIRPIYKYKKPVKRNIHFTWSAMDIIASNEYRLYDVGDRNA